MLAVEPHTSQKRMVACFRDSAGRTDGGMEGTAPAAKAGWQCGQNRSLSGRGRPHAEHMPISSP
ncbi:hypothetical protein GCM10007918_48070 [Piscinibacter gummiphilus]|nr:hypothetical protein GCM10007918_48070 [Piscinibacter gummiphilus]